jgi:hypothetical protein
MNIARERERKREREREKKLTKNRKNELALEANEICFFYLNGKLPS